VFSSADIVYLYGQICDQFGLDRNEAKEVAAEVETHNGLLLQTGYEQFEFAHKSLQEFLTAEYLVKLPSIPDWGMLGRLPYETAIAVAISSNPGAYLAELVFRKFRSRMSEDFIRAFLSRLIIEKPDLGSEASVQLSLLVLLSEYLDLSFVAEGRPWTYQGDRMLLDWEQVVKNSYTATLSEILKCYSTDQIYDTRNPNLIHRLTFQRKLVPTSLHSLIAFFPNTLFVRTSLLNFKGGSKRRNTQQSRVSN